MKCFFLHFYSIQKWNHFGHLDSFVMALLLSLEYIEVEIPQLDESVVEAAEEVGVVEAEAENEAVATVAAKTRLLVAPNLEAK
jgi:hypothetical protein